MHIRSGHFLTLPGGAQVDDLESPGLISSLPTPACLRHKIVWQLLQPQRLHISDWCGVNLRQRDDVKQIDVTSTSGITTDIERIRFSEWHPLVGVRKGITLHFSNHFPGEPGLAGVEAKDDGRGGDNWTTGAINRAKLQSNHLQQTNIQLFYRPDALPVAKQQCQSTEGNGVRKGIWPLQILSSHVRLPWQWKCSTVQE